MLQFWEETPFSWSVWIPLGLLIICSIFAKQRFITDFIWCQGTRSHIHFYPARTFCLQVESRAWSFRCHQWRQWASRCPFTMWCEAWSSQTAASNRWWKQTTSEHKIQPTVPQRALKCDRGSWNEKQFSSKPYPISIFRNIVYRGVLPHWAFLPSLTTSFPSPVCWVGIIQVQVEMQCQIPLLCQPEQFLNYPGVCRGLFHENKI